MAHYAVSARPRIELLSELESRLERGEIEGMEPFGRALSRALADARIRPDNTALWEEEDYCIPPLAQERHRLLERYFTNIAMAPVARGAGWRMIEHLPRLFPSLAMDKVIGGEIE
ncbi:MAG: hypothetical protein GF344_12040 [Chitinivibrionales bacterium]|nr:hypothetical protein [Chitinivibrionales bacterium]MBD3357508.1 hypothetical protein [Chitinivibrionales bacterium]